LVSVAVVVGLAGVVVGLAGVVVGLAGVVGGPGPPRAGGPPALPAAGPRPVLPAAGARPVLLATGTRPGLPTATLSGRRPPPIVPLPRGRIHPRRESRPHPGSPTLADTSSDTTGSTPVCL